MPVSAIIVGATVTAVCSFTARPSVDGPLLLEEGGLSGAGQLGGQIRVARQLAVAGDRVRLTADRVLEDRRFELRGRRRGAAGRLRHGPLHGEAGVVVA